MPPGISFGTTLEKLYIENSAGNYEEGEGQVGRGNLPTQKLNIRRGSEDPFLEKLLEFQ